MITGRQRTCALLAAGVLSLAGCASSVSAASPASQPAPGSGGMTAGMVMPDGSTMGATTPSPAMADAGLPTSAEKMICAAETRSDITEVLGLTKAPAPTGTWRDHLYTCTYRLPMGTLIVSVKQSPNPAAAATYFRSRRSGFDSTESLQGLGESSFGARPGTVVLIKDSDTLTVDATHLPAVFGKESSKRFDFAYELASDILGCWTDG